MAIYEAEVNETRIIRVRYQVEADSLEEAKECFEDGSTEFEEDIENSIEVADRNVLYSTIKEVSK